MNDGESLVGVVGDSMPDLSATIADAGGRSCADDIESVMATDPDFIVAVGTDALLGVARLAPTAPILPVEAGRGFRSVPRDSLDDAIEHLLDGVAETESAPVLSVDHDGEAIARAVADVTLVTSEVAHISEYRVQAAGTHVSQFRADGIVVATPAGSTGYARRVDCPVVAPETGVSAVAPIAPFATDPDHWVLPLDGLRLTVERDETAVTLLADDREVATVAEGEPVDVRADGTAVIAIIPESQTPY